MKEKSIVLNDAIALYVDYVQKIFSEKDFF